MKGALEAINFAIYNVLIELHEFKYCPRPETCPTVSRITVLDKTVKLCELQIFLSNRRNDFGHYIQNVVRLYSSLTTVPYYTAKMMTGKLHYLTWEIGI